MKEATGELNMTVIAVVAIAAVGAFFYAFVWPRVKNSISKSTTCTDAICSSCTVENGTRVCTGCRDTDGNEISGSCTYKDVSEEN